MEKVIIASKNPVKIQATKNGFAKMFPSQKFEFVGITASSNVADQPLSNEETFRGAKNRTDNASGEVKGGDFFIGIEGGNQSPRPRSYQGGIIPSSRPSRD